MLSFNQTINNHKTFTLTGIPGMPEKDFWLALSLCLLYSFTFLGNVIILAVIKVEQHFHEPMYYFLAMLVATDLSLPLSSVPTMISVHWLSWCSVTLDVCVTEMFFIHTFGGVESGVLVAMALDRYVAICDPLRHAAIFTHKLLTQIGFGVTLRAGVLIALCLILIKCRLKHYRTTVVSHSFCEHMAIVKLAAEDTRVNKIYGLFVAFIILGFDIIFITLSYIRIFVTVFKLPQKEARLKAFNTCIAHICVFLVFYLLGFFSSFTHRFGFHIPSYIHILLSNLYLLVPPFLNPIVYGVKTKQIRDRASKIFHLKDAS